MHWAVFMRPIVWMLLGIGASSTGSAEIAVNPFPAILSFLIFWVAGIDGVGCYMLRSHTSYMLTTHRLVMTTGLFQKRSIEILLPKIESIAVNEPYLGRIFGYGTIVVGGTGGTKEAFPLVPRPQNFRTQVQELATT